MSPKATTIQMAFNFFTFHFSFIPHPYGLPEGWGRPHFVTLLTEFCVKNSENLLQLEVRDVILNMYIFFLPERKQRRSKGEHE